MRWVLGVTGACAAVGGVFGGAGGALLAGLAIGGAVPLVLFGLMGAAYLCVSITATTFCASLSTLERFLRGFAPVRPGSPFALRARRWSLRGRALLAQGDLRRRVVTSEDARAVVVWERSRTGDSPHQTLRWRELWLRGNDWVRLARSVEQPANPLATPTLDALAVEVARSLDVPIRSVT